MAMAVATLAAAIFGRTAVAQMNGASATGSARRIALGLPHPGTVCAQCGSVARPNGRCREEVRLPDTHEGDSAIGQWLWSRDPQRSPPQPTLRLRLKGGILQQAHTHRPWITGIDDPTRTRGINIPVVLDDAPDED